MRTPSRLRSLCRGYATIPVEEAHRLPPDRQGVGLQEREFSAAQRKAAARAGAAMKDGSFPILSVKDLESAIKLWSHAKNPQAARRHIIRRAKALAATSQLPDDWVMKKPKKTSESDPTGTIPVRQAALRETDLPEPVTIARDGKHILEVTLIRAGTSRNGNHYQPDVLKEAVPLFEGARAFADHAPDDGRPERSVRDLVGYYRNAYLDEAGRVRAQLHLVPGNDWLFHLLAEAQHNPGLCGLSIDANGDVTRRTQGIRHVNRLLSVSSVDIVTKPAAGGSVDRIIQAERTPTPVSKKKDQTPIPAMHLGTTPEGQGRQDVPSASSMLQEGHNTQRVSAPHRESVQAPPPEPDLASLVEHMKAERDQMRRELDRVTGILAPGTTPGADASSTLSRLAEEIKRDRDLARCRSLLSDRLAESSLPEPVQHKIRKHFSDRIFEESQLSDAIAEEKETLAILTQHGQVEGLGFEKIHLASGMSPLDQVQAAMDKLFDISESEQAQRVPAFSGIREAFYACTGVDVAQIAGPDRALRPELREALAYKVRSGQLTESEALLREADVTTSTFSYLLGTSMNKRLLADYQAWPSEWQKFTTIVLILTLVLLSARLG